MNKQFVYVLLPQTMLRLYMYVVEEDSAANDMTSYANTVIMIHIGSISMVHEVKIIAKTHLCAVIWL